MAVLARLVRTDYLPNNNPRLQQKRRTSASTQRPAVTELTAGGSLEHRTVLNIQTDVVGNSSPSCSGRTNDTPRTARLIVINSSSKAPAYYVAAGTDSVLRPLTLVFYIVHTLRNNAERRTADTITQSNDNQHMDDGVRPISTWLFLLWLQLRRDRNTLIR